MNGARYLGLDLGAETIKLVELTDEQGTLRWTRRALVEHHKAPTRALLEALSDWGWGELRAAAVTGRFAGLVDLPRVPTKEAQAAGYRLLAGPEPATIISIGGHGFSVLELRESGLEVFRENSRCSQGTGNFLRQLVERFDLSIEEASALCADVAEPAPLSGRCPVILKTDMTHLANKGAPRERILAGLYDAVCENVQVLVKPRVSPPRARLVGGVSRSRRIRENFRRHLETQEMTLVPFGDDEAALFLDAVGAAAQAAEQPRPLPDLQALIAEAAPRRFEEVPALATSLEMVERRQAPPLDPRPARRVVLGFDIGSTGSKIVALDPDARTPVWESYLGTGGRPVAAAQQLMRRFLEGPAGALPVVACGATGSGREIVGSLLATCYGVEAVYVLNEIAAHAEGAHHYDPRVDTIFEIGGQDAKYIRLASGRVVDAAMNEACSAGTGSFIEEQGRKFAGVRDVVHLAEEGIEAEGGISLGQHCSVFMAEVIDEAVAAGVDRRPIIAGIYDSVVQNYLNRVKGSRSVGEVIFCQGMPFSSDALAAAVARQTGAQVIIPPNPGTVGALGIALLAASEAGAEERAPLDPSRFLAAEVTDKDTFVCKATKGCGGAGNRCRIDRLQTVVDGKQQRFTWGGGCSLWDRGTGKRKLPDLAPDPFRERRELIEAICAQTAGGDGPQVALTDEFLLKELFPFFATFFQQLGLRVQTRTGADQRALKRGIEQANVPFCAPMQQYHGLVTSMAEDRPDYLFLPLLRETRRAGGEPNAAVCPVVQGSADILSWDLGAEWRGRILSPVIDVGPEDLGSPHLQRVCRELAVSLGVRRGRWRDAYRAAVVAQRRFDAALLVAGRRALDFALDHELLTVVVLGRPYTIHNTVLNSNVPALLREQGAMAVPIDCFPIPGSTPIFEDMYWGYGQRNLRAAHAIRHTPNVYSLWCSNYSCGPDSFNLHFYGYLMEGKPYAVIETDGHSGDAGTKTRVEAFLHCVRQDLSAGPRGGTRGRTIDAAKAGLVDIRARGERLLIPRMGPGAEVLAACLQGAGVQAEALPMPDRETVRLGRRHTSGKECVPMTITLGSLLQRLEPERESDQRFAFFMPRANGPCRFGAYHMLHTIVLERLGWGDRVRVWSPADSDYFQGVSPGFSALVMLALAASDVLLEALYDVRPVESRPGAAQAVYERAVARLSARCLQLGAGPLTVTDVLLEATTGRLFGIPTLLEEAARAMAEVKGDRALPTVLVVGEIYVRCDPFANDFVIDKLEERGIRVRFAPFVEWLEYTDSLKGDLYPLTLADRLKRWVTHRILERTYAAMAGPLAWHARTTVHDSLTAATDYIRPALSGESVLTLGGPLHEWREGVIDGVVSVGPLECMPTKIAESQFFHVAEREGLASLTLPLNGDPMDLQTLDTFAFEVRARFRRRGGGEHPQPAARRPLPVARPQELAPRG